MERPCDLPEVPESGQATPPEASACRDPAKPAGKGKNVGFHPPACELDPSGRNLCSCLRSPGQLLALPGPSLRGVSPEVLLRT